VVKKPKQQFSDIDLFRQEMVGVVPLKAPQTTDSKTPRSLESTRRSKIVAADFSWPGLSSADDQSHQDTDDGSSHRKNGVQKRTMQKLKRGRFPVAGQLDLHNMSVEAGHRALLEFIAEAKSPALECIRVIHGKGLRSQNGPRLKLMTRQVLRDHHRVLAFTPCKQADGGTGAMDVLLKSS
jgi:DNA-nicking Smr family endonuclease